jgi:hypothetical protein
MRLRRTVWAFSLGMSMALAQSHARADDGYTLTGLKSFKLVVENLDSEAERCGITLSSLDSILRSVLGQSRIQVVNAEHDDGYIYLDVLAERRCLVRVDLEVHTPVTVIRSHNYAIATIWRTGGIVGSDHLTEMVEEYANRLVNDWNEVNQ